MKRLTTALFILFVFGLCCFQPKPKTDCHQATTAKTNEASSQIEAIQAEIKAKINRAQSRIVKIESAENRAEKKIILVSGKDGSIQR
jgi:hypothetical protein